MKHKTIILGVAAALVTVGTCLAFETSRKFKTVKVYGKTAAGNIWKQCQALWTNVASGGCATKCKTVDGEYTLHGLGSGNCRTWYTKTNSSHQNAGNHTTLVTTVH